jgi:hypothetical protein
MKVVRMNFDDTIVPLAVFGSMVAVVWLIVAGLVKIFTMKTLRDTARSSPESLALVAEKISARSTTAGDTAGLLGIALGVALAVAALIGAPDMRVALLQLALLPGFMGAAQIARRWLLPAVRQPATPTPPAE